MIDITLNIGGLDLSNSLSTYQVNIEYTYPTSITTIDGKEHFHEWKRPIVLFKLIPMSDSQVNSLFNKLSSSPVTVTYWNPYTNSNVTAPMRIEGNLENAFGINSVDGNRYYKGGQIKLRQLTVM